MILFLFSRFFTKFFISIPSPDNNNVINNGVTRVVVNIFPKYNNGSIATTTTTKTHCSLVKPILGLGGVSPKFPSVSALFPSILEYVMMVFKPTITYFKWLI